MNIGILGPLDVRDRDGREIRLPTGRERSLLVLLLLNRGQVVSSDRIVDALWGEHPPGTAAKAVQGYVSHLRRLIEPAAGEILLTRSPGYLLRPDGVSVDAFEFERLAAEGRRALEDGALQEAAALLEEALALWRGAALTDFTYDDFAQAEIRRLEELRLDTTEDRIEALLEVGRHGELVGPLDALIQAYPLRERLRGQQMLALYRCGRQADALQAYRDLRRLLAAELGLDPGPDLQRLERAILAQDPTLEAPPPQPGRTAERSEPHVPEPPRPARKPRGRRRLVVGAVALPAAVAAAIVLPLVLRNGAPSPVTIVPPAVVAIDPATNRVVAAVTTGSKPAAVAAGAGAVWVGDGRDGTVTRIDPTTRRVTKTIGIGAPAIDLAAGSGSVWVATGSFGSVIRIDAELGAIADRIELGEEGDPVVPAATSVAAADGRVWVGAFDGLLRIHPGSGRVTARVDLGRSSALQVAAARGAVWATIVSSRAKRVEASSAQVTAEFYAGQFVFPLALGPSALWVGSNRSLYKVDPVTGATVLTSSLGTWAEGIAVGAGAVWVSLPERLGVARVDAATGQTRLIIPVGGSPQELAFADGLLWVAVQGAPAG